uniref:Uncharacterized protein n=1 Tax=Candidatus Kentrum sp. UNK TaxID=2126344 RepID=A0A451AFD5_9GAMM|nr:MAG: hypothetical protein BECKUNK1418G_GA0071005_10507 [Candidatus Kentron sp. UNK]
MPLTRPNLSSSFSQVIRETLLGLVLFPLHDGQRRQCFLIHFGKGKWFLGRYYHQYPPGNNSASKVENLLASFVRAKKFL